MTAILQKYLEYKLPQVLRRKFPSLYFDNGQYCPQVADLPVGAQYIALETVQHYGEAAIAAGQAQDAPLTEVTIGEETYPVIYVFGGAYYTDPELKSAEFASRNGQILTNFREERLVAMRRMIDVKSHKLCAYGDSRYGIDGFLNNPDVTLENTTTYKYYAANATAQAIIDLFTNAVHSLWTGSNFVEFPNLVAVAPVLWLILNTRFRTDLSDSTLMDAVLKVNPSIQQIVPWRELASAELEANGVHADNTNKDRMMVYTLSPENVRRHFNQLTIMPPEQDKMRYLITAYKGFSGVKFFYPGTARYVDYPIATTAN